MGDFIHLAPSRRVYQTINVPLVKRDRKFHVEIANLGKRSVITARPESQTIDTINDGDRISSVHWNGKTPPVFCFLRGIIMVFKHFMNELTFEGVY
jgi:hypothetical protein